MCSVTVRVRATEFGITMTAIGEWLNVNRHARECAEGSAGPKEISKRQSRGESELALRNGG